MSDSESTAAPAHPTTGGKSIETVQAQQNKLQGERHPYKSWRKKYRKMRVKFDGALEENKTLFKQEHKLEGTAKRLREELDELMDILLDMNQSPAVPADLRFDVRLPSQRERPNAVPPDITPEASNDLMAEYTSAVSKGIIPPLDLHVIREQIDGRLAAQGVRRLENFEQSSCPYPVVSEAEGDSLPEEARGDEPPGFLTTAQEFEYLQRLDAKLGDQLSLDKEGAHAQSPHQAELTPRELERHMELLNPQSQHNWLKTHTKMHAVPEDDAESLASLEGNSKPSGRRKGKNLAKQVGDRAIERAYDGMSPSAASGFDDDEFPAADDPSASGKKRARDPDGSYKAKGGRGGGVKGKRKRATEEGAGTSKKARMSESFAE